MHTAGRRFPSLTNEAAVRPHESAFRHWSSPELLTVDASPVAIPQPASTERADTMAAHNPPSFTVYTPDQTRSAPLRRSMPDLDDGTDGVGARTLLKWTGIGIVAGLAVLTALIVVLNFGGDRTALSSTSSNARSALVGPTKTAEAPKPAAIAIAKPAAIELDATPTLTIPAATPAPSAPAKKAPAAKPVAAKKKR